MYMPRASKRSDQEGFGCLSSDWKDPKGLRDNSAGSAFEDVFDNVLLRPDTPDRRRLTDF